MSALDGSIVNTLLPLLGRSLGAGVADVEWVVTVYLLVVSGLLLSFGRLGDLRGHKRIYVLGFGIFMAPFHPTGQNPTLALERDLDLISHLDRLGFDEAWIGEHHSAGFEIIAAVSAPTSLAIEIAERFGVTLAGFVRSGRVTIYSQPQRISELSALSDSPLLQ